MCIRDRIRPEVAIALHDAHARYLYAADDDSPKVLELHFAKHKRAQYLYALEESRWLRPLVDLYKAPFYRLIRHYDRFVVLTEEDRTAWQRPGVDNIAVIPNAQTFPCTVQATLDHRRVIALGRNTPQKQFDARLGAGSPVSYTHREVYKRQLPSSKTGTSREPESVTARLPAPAHRRPSSHGWCR